MSAFWLEVDKACSIILEFLKTDEIFFKVKYNLEGSCNNQDEIPSKLWQLRDMYHSQYISVFFLCRVCGS